MAAAAAGRARFGVREADDFEDVRVEACHGHLESYHSNRSIVSGLVFEPGSGVVQSLSLCALAPRKRGGVGVAARTHPHTHTSTINATLEGRQMQRERGRKQEMNNF